MAKHSETGLLGKVKRTVLAAFRLVVTHRSEIQETAKARFATFRRVLVTTPLNNQNYTKKVTLATVVRVVGNVVNRIMFVKDVKSCAGLLLKGNALKIIKTWENREHNLFWPVR